MKKDGTSHPKTLALANRLGVPRAHAVGILELLWHATASFAPRGNIGKLTDAAIAGCCDWTGEASAFVAILVECGFVERSDAHRLIIHDWIEHCPQYVRAKMAKVSDGFITSAETERPLEPGASGDCIGDLTDTPSPTQPSLTKPNPAQPAETRLRNRVDPDGTDPGCAILSGREGERVSGPGSGQPSFETRRLRLGREVAKIVTDPRRQLECLAFIERLNPDELGAAERDLLAAKKADKPGGVIVHRWLRAANSRT